MRHRIWPAVLLLGVILVAGAASVLFFAPLLLEGHMHDFAKSMLQSWGFGVHELDLHASWYGVWVDRLDVTRGRIRITVSNMVTDTPPTELASHKIPRRLVSDSVRVSADFGHKKRYTQKNINKISMLRNIIDNTDLLARHLVLDLKTSDFELHLSGSAQIYGRRWWLEDTSGHMSSHGVTVNFSSLSCSGDLTFPYVKTCSAGKADASGPGLSLHLARAWSRRRKDGSVVASAKIQGHGISGHATVFFAPPRWGVRISGQGHAALDKLASRFGAITDPASWPVMFTGFASSDGTIVTGTLKLEGDGMTIVHSALSPEGVEISPVSGVVSFALAPDGSFTLEGAGRMHGADLALSAAWSEVSPHVLPGQASPRSGKHMESEKHRYLAITAYVPYSRCQTLAKSLPRGLLPHLKSMKFSGHIRALTSLTLDLAKPQANLGFAAVNSCRVRHIPRAYDPVRLEEPFVFSVTEPAGFATEVVVGPENEDYRPLDVISPYMVKAVLTTEDARFFSHHGFITREFGPALLRDLKAGSFKYGASSITMQVVKNVFLTRRKTISRKLEELILTWLTEKALSKEHIMEIYLNIIELGPGIYGVGKGARIMFGKDASELTPLEAIYLASVLPSPKKRFKFYCDGRVPRRWTRYVHYLLKIMHRRGHITDQEYEQYKDQDIIFDRTWWPGRNECNALIRKYSKKD